MFSAIGAAALLAGSAYGQVTATFPNGVTNPPAPSRAAAGTPANQTSMARLLTLNGIDDFCLFGPPEPLAEAGQANLIGNVEPIVVAYCLQQRNNARLIPDGTIYSAHFIKTPLYVQIQGYFDGTKINIPYGDDGGELDPHGAENLGNPVGGNVTSNVSGQDVFYEEWMSFMSYNQFCLRICTAETSSVSAALQCEHELDIMGCQFVMPGDYTNNSFTSCEGDAAAPPGLYPLPGGGTSTFRQLYTGTYVDGAGAPQTYTVGNSITPAAPFSTPATSNCQTFTSIGNGNTGLAVATPRPSSSAGASSAGVSSGASASASTTGAASSRASGLAASASASASAAPASGAGAVVPTTGVLGLALSLAAVGLGGLALVL